jgi:cell division protein FtsL
MQMGASSILGFGILLIIVIAVGLIVAVYVIALNSQRSARVQKQMADTLAKIADDKKQG